MDLLPSSVHSFAQAASGALVSSVWQGIVLVASIAVALRILSRVSASARSAIWTGVLLLVMMLPVLYLSPFHSREASGLSIHPRESWGFALVGLWGTVTIIRAGILAKSAIRLRRIMNRALLIEPHERLLTILNNGSRPLQLWTSMEIVQPCVAGFFSPRILVPASLLRALAIQDLEQIILHEMEHLRRRDHWTNLLQQASLVLFPLNPAVIWVDHHLAAERELACDDEVLRITGARKAYATCLTKIAEHAFLSRGLLLAVAVLGRFSRGSELSHRVRRILRSPDTEMKGARLWVTSSLIFGFMIASGLLLAHSPRLISFAPETNGGVQEVQEALAPSRGPSFQGTAMHAQFVRATMPSVKMRTHHTVAAVVRRTAKPKADQRRSENSPWMVLTDWSPDIRMSRPAKPSDRLSQASYAAFPFGDGWLIVQL